MPEIKGKGSLRERSKGVWIGRFNLGEDPQRPGKYLYSPSRTFHCEHEWEARMLMEEYRNELMQMDSPALSKSTLESYCDEWFKLRQGTHRSPRTADREALDIRHIKELFPKVKLKKITPAIIKTTYDDARQKGRFDKELYQINKRLRQILDSAVDDGIIQKNPARKVVLPKPEPAPKDYLDPDRLRLFKDEVLSLPWCGEKIAILILIYTGIRPGEAYGLSWSACSFSKCQLMIEAQYSNDMKLRKPKSKASEDWVAISDALWANLLEWKEIQRDLLGKLCQEQTPDTPIVTNSLGGRFDPTNFGRFFRNFCVDHGFGSYSVVTHTFEQDGKIHYRGKGYSGLCPNMFRDIQATIFVSHMKTDVRTLKDHLRHSDEITSLKHYTHRVEENEYGAATSFASLIDSPSTYASPTDSPI